MKTTTLLIAGHDRKIRSMLRNALEDERSFMREAEHATETPGTVTQSVQSCLDGMCVNPDRLELLNQNHDGKDCGLPSGAFRLLSACPKRAKRVLARDQLINTVRGVECAFVSDVQIVQSSAAPVKSA